MTQLHWIWSMYVGVTIVSIICYINILFNPSSSVKKHYNDKLISYSDGYIRKFKTYTNWFKLNVLRMKVYDTPKCTETVNECQNTFMNDIITRIIKGDTIYFKKPYNKSNEKDNIWKQWSINRTLFTNEYTITTKEWIPTVTNSNDVHIKRFNNMDEMISYIEMQVMSKNKHGYHMINWDYINNAL